MKTYWVHAKALVQASRFKLREIVGDKKLRNATAKFFVRMALAFGSHGYCDGRINTGLSKSGIIKHLTEPSVNRKSAYRYFEILEAAQMVLDAPGFGVSLAVSEDLVAAQNKPDGHQLTMRAFLKEAEQIWERDEPIERRAMALAEKFGSTMTTVFLKIEHGIEPQETKGILDRAGVIRNNDDLNERHRHLRSQLKKRLDRKNRAGKSRVAACQAA